MKRFFIGMLILLTVSVFGATVHAGVNDFTITDYDIKYMLGKDAENRSTLKTVETITALFPDFDQNHGIERSLVDEYDKHSTNLKVLSVTDENGSPRNWKMMSGNVLRIGDADKYVHGLQTYVITFMQRDVTRYFADTDKDEFYWDTNGVEWRVPIEKLHVSLELDPSITSAISSSAHCYVGYSNSSDQCEINDAYGVYEAKSVGLYPGQNITLALGFDAGTFSGYQPTTGERIGRLVGMAVVISNVFVGPIAGTIAAVWLFSKRRAFRRNNPEIVKVLNQPVIAEYLPPKDASVIDSSVVRSDVVTGAAVSGQIIDWAVRHFIEIRETKAKSFWSKAEYTLEAKQSFSTLSEREQALAKDLFGTLPQAGTTTTTKDIQKRPSTIQSRCEALAKNVKNAAMFYDKTPEISKWFNRAGWIVLGVGVLSIFNLIIMAVGVLAFTIGASSKQQLSVRGEQLKKYLEGLKLYIGVAEEERLRMLQSPEGADKVGTIDDAGAKIKLYEKVLPYAVLFGQEKEWTKVLGKLYEDTGTSPTWSTGSTAFNAAMFSNMTSSFTSSISSASSYSSSSGGSSGGGFSGGGGGGGGGGGW